MKDQLTQYITQLLSPEMRRVVQGAFYRRFGFCPNDLDELIQETVVKQYEFFLRNELSDRTIDGINAYFATSCQNAYLNRNRKMSNRLTMSYDALEDSHEWMEELSVTPDEPDEEPNAEYQVALKVLQKLPEHLREVLMLRYEGMEYEEIAEHLDVTLNTVKTRIFQARNKSREFRKRFRNN